MPCFSRCPARPIIYYGDEIGMGDNIYLGDRDGVRTPMQWNADRNGGFLACQSPEVVFAGDHRLPSIILPRRNVEIEQNSPHSLLWWMRRIINMRKRFTAFGRGSIEFLSPDNSKVLAFLRRHEDETLLVVANLSRFAQCVELDLSEFRGQTPVELFGQTQFPRVGELPYFLTLGTHAFYWFRLQWQREEHVELAESELPNCRIDGDPKGLFTGRAQTKLEGAMGAFLGRHRWFAGKARVIQTIELFEVFPCNHTRNRTPLESAERPEPAAMYLLLVRVNYVEGEPDTYAVPVVLADNELAASIIGDHPNAGIMTVSYRDGQHATLCEATWEQSFWSPLLDQIARRRSIKGVRGELIAEQTRAFRRLRGNRDLPTTVHGGQQSNTSVVFGDRLILKLFRRLGDGLNPDLEVGRFLTGRIPEPHVPDVAGAIEYRREGDGPPMTLAILHEYRANQGDAWVYTLDELSRYLERVQSERMQDVAELRETAELLELAEREPPELAQETIGSYLKAIQLLGQRTAELHISLASSTDPDFAPELFSKLYQRSLYQTMRTQARKSLDVLRRQIGKLPEQIRDAGRHILDSQSTILARFREILDQKITARRLRCHGDFHLGQVLFTGKDFVIIDFEGEPDKSIGERRIKRSPLRDVAGMIRSLHYASHATLMGQSSLARS